jgi:hypothetical protein
MLSFVVGVLFGALITAAWAKRKRASDHARWARRDANLRELAALIMRRRHSERAKGGDRLD